VTDTENTQKNMSPAITEEALKAHDQAFRAYSELKERVITQHERLVKHQKACAAAQEESKSHGDYWRKLLRSSDGEVTKDIRSARTESLAARELSEELQLIVNQVELQLGIDRLDLYELRSKYLSLRSEARTAYSLQCRETAASEVLETSQGDALFIELTRSGHLLSHKELINNDKAAASLGREIARLAEVAGFDCKLPVPRNETWAELSLEQADAVEQIDRNLEESNVARKKMRESLQSRQKNMGA